MFWLFRTPRSAVGQCVLPESDTYVRFITRGQLLVVQPLDTKLHAHQCKVILHDIERMYSSPHPAAKHLVLHLKRVRSLCAMTLPFLERVATLAQSHSMAPAMYGLSPSIRDQLRAFGLERRYRFIYSRRDFHRLSGG